MNASLLRYLDKQPKSFFWILGPVIALLIGGSEYLLGYGISVSILYLIPISLAAWFAGKRAGSFLALTSAVIWFAVDELSANPFANTYVPFWNAAVRLFLFFTIVFLLDGFKREKIYARKDYLTGLRNLRHFFEMAGAEINRSRRYGHPFSVAYIDVDDFKSINDQFGHSEGDALLKSIAEIIRSNVRATDIDARLGEDEFALLLPETGAERTVRFFNKLHHRLSEASVDGRQVTVSVGVVTFVQPPESIDAMIRTVDQLMYAAKARGKNLVQYKVIDTKRA